MKNKKNKKTLYSIILGVALILITSIGVSYAFFTANLTGGESATTITVGGGTMNITFAGGSAITVSNIHPQAAAIVTKTFTVTGNSTTTLGMSYKLTLQVTANTFTATSLKYQLASTNTGGNGTLVPAKLTNQNIDAGANAIVLGTGSFASPTTGEKAHTYVLTIYFPDTGGDQNIDQGKNFTAYVKIENV